MRLILSERKEKPLRKAKMSGPCEVSSEAVSPLPKQSASEKAEFDRALEAFKAKGGKVTVKLSASQKRAAKAEAKTLKSKGIKPEDASKIASALAEAASVALTANKAKSKALLQALEAAEKPQKTLIPVKPEPQKGKFGGHSFECDALATEVTEHRIQTGKLDPKEAMRILTEGDTLQIK